MEKTYKFKIDTPWGKKGESADILDFAFAKKTDYEKYPELFEEEARPNYSIRFSIEQCFQVDRRVPKDEVWLVSNGGILIKVINLEPEKDLINPTKDKFLDL